MPLGRTMAQVLSNPLSTRYALSLTFLLNLSPQRTFPLTIEDGCQNNHTFLSFRNSQQATSRRLGALLSPFGMGGSGALLYNDVCYFQEGENRQWEHALPVGVSKQLPWRLRRRRRHRRVLGAPTPSRIARYVLSQLCSLQLYVQVFCVFYRSQPCATAPWL